MPRTRVLIEVSPSMLAVAVCRGCQVLDARSARFERGEWGEAWTTQLAETSPTLAGFVSELDCAGSTCEIVYHAPGAVIGVTSCAQGAGVSAALNAASLQLASVATFPLTENPFDARELFKDASARAGTPERTKSQLHTIAAADTDANVRALSTWAELAGLRVEGLTPYEAAATTAAVGAIGAEPAGSDVTASVWVGRHLSVLAVGDPSRLMFVRTIGIGSESLVEALTKPIRAQEPSEANPAGGARADVGLDRERARELLREIGVPSPQQPLPCLPGIVGSAVLPALQPPLQRLAIEIKQSLRFGVSDDRRAGVRLRLCGPGAPIPNLGSTLGRLSGCESGDQTIGEAPREAASPQEFALLSERAPSFVGMQSGDRLAIRRVRRAMAIGVGAAAAFLAVGAFSAHAQLSKERERLAAVKSCASGDAALADLQRVSLDARTAVNALNNRVLHRMGASPRWGPLMETISASTPGAIRLSSIRMSACEAAKGGVGAGAALGADAHSCVLRGHVLLAQTGDSAGTIKQFADKLGSGPLIGGVRLGATARSSLLGAEVQTFELTLALVAVPFDAEAGPAHATGSDQP